MRKAIIAVLSVILVFAVAIPIISAAKPDIKINGDLSDREEWEEATTENDSVNSQNVKYVATHTKYIVDEQSSSIYYAIIATSNDKRPENTEDQRRIAITMPNGHQYEFSGSGRDTSDDNYDITYSCKTNDKPCEFYFEMSVVFEKDGWNNDDVTIKYQVYDYENHTFPEKKITVPFRSQNGPEDYGTTDSSGSKTTKASKTTTEKSTKTTTQKLTGGSRVPTTRRGVTTSAATTTKKPTEPQTTAAKTTAAKVRTTKAKTARTRTTKAQSSRETASYAAGTGETTVVYMLDAEALSALINTTASETQADRSAFGIKTIPRSTLLKGVTAAAALILFGIIGAWAVKSRADDDEPAKDDKEDNNKKED